MLHYFHAYCHLELGGKAFEAAREVQAAALAPIGPPFPWRALERKVLERLATEYPDDERLKRWLEVTGLRT
jgi:hypothetical protein